MGTSKGPQVGESPHRRLGPGVPRQPRSVARFEEHPVAGLDREPDSLDRRSGQPCRGDEDIEVTGWARGDDNYLHPGADGGPQCVERALGDCAVSA